MDLTCSVYGLVVNVQKDACFGLNLTLHAIFKIYGQFSENAIFEKIVFLFYFFQNFNFLSVFFSLVHQAGAHNEVVENLVKDFPVFTFLPKKLSISIAN